MSVKLHPFWWLNPVVTCDVVKSCLEGTYSSYSEKWAVETTKAFSYYLNNVAFDAVNVYCMGSGLYEIRKLSDGSLVDNDTQHASGYAQVSCAQSVLGKYVVHLKKSDSYQQIVIYKDGALLESHYVGDDLDLFGVGMSPDGKYIVVLDNTGGTSKLRLLEGS